MVIGMAQGIMLPAANVVLTHWVPSALRGRDFAFAASGQFLGAALAMAAMPIIGMRQRGRDRREYSFAVFLSYVIVNQAPLSGRNLEVVRDCDDAMQEVALRY